MSPNTIKVFFFLSSTMLALFSFFAAVAFIQKGSPPINLQTSSFPTQPMATPSLQAGDLVVVSGRSFFSQKVKAMNQREQVYSHCGIVVKEGEEWLVVHAIGGSDNRNNKLQKTPFTDFTHPGEVEAVAVYRYALTTGQARAVGEQAVQYWERGVKFDFSFDLETKDKFYCSELMYTCLEQVLGKPDFLSLSKFDNRLFIGIDDLYLNDFCTKIFEHKYD